MSSKSKTKGSKKSNASKGVKSGSIKYNHENKWCSYFY